MMDQVTLPSEAKIEFIYQSIDEVPSVTEGIVSRFHVPNSHRVDPGIDDVLISYITDKGKVALRMFDTEMITELFSSVSEFSQTRIQPLGRGSVRSYEVFRKESFIAIALNYDTDKEVYLMHKEGGKWLPNLYSFTISDNAAVRYGRDFVVIAEVGSFIETVTWGKKDSTWNREVFSFKDGHVNLPVLVKAFDRIFVVYDDYELWLGFKDSQDKWKSKVVTRLPGLVKRTNEIFQQFDLTNSAQKQLLTVYKTDAMQFSNNLLLLNSWKLQGTQLFTETHFIVLDKDYGAALVQKITHPQDDLGTLSLELAGNNGTFITLGYEKDDKFKLVVKSMRGPIFDELHRNLEREQEERRLVEYRNSVLNSVGQAFILKLTKYTAVLSLQTAVCGENLYTFNGRRWVEKKKPNILPKSDRVSFLLGDKLVLQKDNAQSSLKLFIQGSDKNTQGNIILDLEVKHLNETIIMNMYPVYLAYQEGKQRIGVVEFSTEGNVYRSYKLPNNEQLSPWSSYQTLITRESENLVFRPQLGIRKLLPNHVITNVIVYFDGGRSKRSTGYDYEPASAKVFGNTIYYSRTTVIPGSDKLLFGWIEEIKDSKNYTVVEIKVFGAQGDLIKTVKATKENNTNSTKTVIDNDDVNNVLLDKTGKLEVVQISLHTISDEEVGFYGFENYELYTIGHKNSTKRRKKWVFKKPNLVKQSFALTGGNFLRLTGGSLNGIFEPKNQNQNYVASCWIRLHERYLQLGDVAPCIKTVVYNKKDEEILGMLGEVKNQHRDWFYLEVAIDLLYLKHLYKSILASPNSTFTDLDGDSLKLSVSIVPEANTTIDVDHVRFSPLNSDFVGHVYNAKTGQVTASINANGLITRHLYDKYQVQIASINEQGSLESLSTYKKASSIGQIDKLKTKVNVKPETGFYEEFSPFSFKERWNLDNANSWKISPNQLKHTTNTFNVIRLNSHEINSKSYGVRMCFSLQSEVSSIKLGNDIELVRKGSKALIRLIKQEVPIPVDGEILTVVMNSRVFVWVDGGLYFDSLTNSSVLNWQVSGHLKISDVMIFTKPEIKVDYLNELDDLMQHVVLEGENSVIVTEYLYDELGRGAITTKPVRLKRCIGEPLLRYYSKLNLNRDPYSSNSVWKTGRLEGEIINAVGHFGYHRVKYDNNPLNEKIAVGLPGQEFSIDGPFSKRYASSTQHGFIQNYFPADKNFTYWVEYKPGNVTDISVYDNKKNKVAWYMYAPGRRRLLSTYEYDENNKVVKSLPPEYHQRAATFLTPFQTKSQINENRYLQDKLGTHASYDAKGNIVSITTPDAGKVEYLYNEGGLLKFIVYCSNIENQGVESVTYFNYDEMGRLTSTGDVKNPPSPDKLLSSSISINDTEEYQQFQLSLHEREPTLRGNVERTITFNNGEPLVEESIFKTDKDILSKRIIIPLKDKKIPMIISINKIYQAKKLQFVEYPISFQGQPLKITYNYNNLGKVTGIGILGYKSNLVSLDYSSDGLQIREEHLPDTSNNFTREYCYNSPGFVTEMKDKFLTEEVLYTSGSYGGHGYGDGTVTQTRFRATWYQSCDNNELELNEESFVSESLSAEESNLCFHELKERGYIDQNNRQAKEFYPALEVTLPIVCSHGVTGHQIQQILGKKGFPTEYGHSYDYGIHKELTKAKYFVGKEPPSPLQPNSFSDEISGINHSESLDIWHILTKESIYLIPDADKVDDSLSHSSQGKSLIRSDFLLDFNSVSEGLIGYKLPLENYLLFSFSQRQNITLNITNAFLKWSGGTITDNQNQKIIRMLEKNQYLQNPVNKEYIKALIKYKEFIPEITRVLLEHFGKQLGKAEFDVQSYEIDANGNHKIYYTGFDAYQLKYRNNTNQVSGVIYKSYTSPNPEKEYVIRHDSRGNIVQALHKGINVIHYHPVSNRVTTIELTNGETVSFYYDAKGERILKRITDNRGVIIKEKHYIRDEFGRVLVERQITYFGNAASPDILLTAYIYGPRGLLGFIRREEFFSVITDHEGSVRLVVKGAEVVAAYDYLPYGGVMREFGPDPESHVSYRYTGQEWDEELGLYNYHARFYDPSIGRFYQVDPKMQYFSPYKYAGNSPVSMVDPDGEIAFLALLPFMVLGAYLGGASYNSHWNPLKWKFNANTLKEIIVGGFAGYFVPTGAVSSFNTLTSTAGLTAAEAVTTMTVTGVGAAYLSSAATHSEWDLTKFNYSSPATYNAMFQGVSKIFKIGGDFKSAKEFCRKLGKEFAKGISLTRSLDTGGNIVIELSKKWDFSKPETYQGIIDSIAGPVKLPKILRLALKTIHQNTLNSNSFLQSSIELNNKYLSNEFLVSNLRDILRKTNSLASLKNIRSTPFSKDRITFLEGLYAHRFSRTLVNLDGGTLIPESLAVPVSSETGFDFSNTVTYLNIIRRMVLGGQKAATLRKYYKEQSFKDLFKKPRIKAKQSTAKEDTIAAYKRILVEGDSSVSSLTDYHPLVTNGQRGVHNVNTETNTNKDVVVALTKELATVKFPAGTSSPSVILFIDRQLNSVTYLKSFTNNNLTREEIVLVDQSVYNAVSYIKEYKRADLTERLVNKITNKAITDIIYKSFKNITSNDNLSKLMSELFINEVKTYIKEAKTVKFDKIYFDYVLKHFLFKNIEAVNKILGLTKTNNRVEKQEILLDVGQLNTVVRAYFGYPRKSESLLVKSNGLLAVKYLFNELQVHRSEIVTNFWKDSEVEYEHVTPSNELDELFPTSCYPTNCAEASSAVAMFSRLLSYVTLNRKGKVYSMEDITYSPTYNAPNPFRLVLNESFSNSCRGLRSLFDGCGHYKMLKNSVKNVMTDDDWVNKIDNIIKSLNSEVFSNKRLTLNFLMPYNQLPLEISKNNGQKNRLSKKQKRSLEQNMLVFTQSDENSNAEFQGKLSRSVETETARTLNSVVSSAVRPKSFIINISNWVKDFTGALSSYKYNNHNNNQPNTLPVDSIVDVNGTLLLLDLLVRKVTGAKLAPSGGCDGSLVQAQVSALNITDAFEHSMREAAAILGLPDLDLNFDPVPVQSAVLKEIRNGKLEKIREILYSFANEAYPKTERSGKFLAYIKQFLEEL